MTAFWEFAKKTLNVFHTLKRKSPLIALDKGTELQHLVTQSPLQSNMVMVALCSGEVLLPYRLSYWKNISNSGVVWGLL